MFTPAPSLAEQSTSLSRGVFCCATKDGSRTEQSQRKATINKTDSAMQDLSDTSNTT